MWFSVMNLIFHLFWWHFWWLILQIIPITGFRDILVTFLSLENSLFFSPLLVFLFYNPWNLSLFLVTFITGLFFFVVCACLCPNIWLKLWNIFIYFQLFSRCLFLSLRSCPKIWLKLWNNFLYSQPFSLFFSFSMSLPI